MRLTRRSLVRTGLLTAALPVLDRLGLPLIASGSAQAEEWRHGITLFDEPKYPAHFKHFEYVNPHAPKGGTVRLGAPGSFDSFNIVVAGVKGTIARGIAVVYDTLLTESSDEPSTSYGLLAEALKYPADFAWTIYRLNPKARWHDGKPVTPEDVIFSLEVFKTYSPMYSSYYRHVEKAEKTGDHEVKFTFDAPGNREMPSILGQLRVLPKHWWEGADSAGNKRDVTSTTLEIPLGSGPYRLKEFVAGRTLVFERVKNYWGNDVNVNLGQNNFDEMRFEYFRDQQVELEALKADQIDWRVDSSAKDWATAYDFQAIKDKRVVREEFPILNIGWLQALAFNTRRDKFKDPRVRQAFNYAYDFEEMNKQLFFGAYRRVDSYFSGTELASSGLPQGLELEILESVRDKVPRDLFTKPYQNPVGGSPEAVRNNLREGTRLLREAGWEIRGGKLTNVRTGEPMVVEILISQPGLERIALFYKPALERLGITITARNIDVPQYQNRLRQWDFDLVFEMWLESLSPGNEQREFWGSQAADTPGSRNLIGIKNPAVDAMIERVIFAKNRAELIAASKALDRVLLWNYYIVPQYNYLQTRVAHWDRFSHADPLPKYGMSGFPNVWWWDAQKAAKIGSSK